MNGTMKQKRLDMRLARRSIFYAVLAFLLLVLLFPIVWTFLTSVKTRVDALAIPPRWLFLPTLQNFREVLFAFDVQIPRSLVHSIIIASSTTFITSLLALPAAYAIARWRSRSRGVLSFAILFARMLPPMVIIIPFYILYVSLNLFDTYGGLIFLYVASTLPLAIWIMIIFIEDVPQEIEEAALIDGCSRLGVITRVVLPLVRGGLGASAIFVFLETWNEFLFALMLTSTNTRTVQVSLYGFITLEETQWGLLTATAGMIMVPVIVLAFIFQKYIVKGMTLGAVR